MVTRIPERKAFVVERDGGHRAPVTGMWLREVDGLPGARQTHSGTEAPFSPTLLCAGKRTRAFFGENRGQVTAP